MNQSVKKNIERLAPWNFLIEVEPGIFTVPRAQWPGIWHNIVAQDYITRTIYSLLGNQQWGRPEDTTVLDIGCNEGWLSLLLAQAGFMRVVGIDINPANIEKAQFLQRHSGLNNLEFVCGSAADFSAEEPFDIVIMLGVLNHCSDPVGMLRTARAVTAGRMIFDVDALVADPTLAATGADFDMDAFSVTGGMQCHLEPASQVTSKEHGNLVFQYSRQALWLLMQGAGFTNILEVAPRLAMPPHYRSRRRVMMLAQPDTPGSCAGLDVARDREYSQAQYNMSGGQPMLEEEGYRGFNIVSYGQIAFGVPQGAFEGFDLLAVARHPQCICASNVAAVRAGIDNPDMSVAASERAAALLVVGRELLWLSRHSDARIVLAEAVASPLLAACSRAEAHYFLGRAAVASDPEFAAQCWRLSAEAGNHQAAAKLDLLAHGQSWPMAHHLFD